MRTVTEQSWAIRKPPMRPGIQIIKGRLHVNPAALDDARQLVADLKCAAADAEHQARAATPRRAHWLMQNARQARRDADRFALEIEHLEGVIP